MSVNGWGWVSMIYSLSIQCDCQMYLPLQHCLLFFLKTTILNILMNRKEINSPDLGDNTLLSTPHLFQPEWKGFWGCWDKFSNCYQSKQEKRENSKSQQPIRFSHSFIHNLWPKFFNRHCSILINIIPLQPQNWFLCSGKKISYLISESI